MKTKEEILKPFLIKSYGQFVVTEECALQAMEEHSAQFKKKKKVHDVLYASCLDAYQVWCKVHDKEFDWNGLQGKSLKSLLAKIKKSFEDKFKQDAKDDDLINGFRLILNHLPEWYKTNAFSIAVINSKYSEIISQIKNGQSSSKNKGGFDLDKAHDLIDRVFDAQGKP